MPPSSHRILPPPRLARLLWLLALNGSLLAFQGLIQRADGGAKLLWIKETHMNRQAIAQFGPYAYRSNAAQYFNLLWPAMLGFWWWREQVHERRTGRRAAHRILIPLSLLVAVCPIISLSRAGAIVTVVNMAAGGAVLLATLRGSRRKMASAITGAILIVAGLTLYFNGAALAKRFASSSKDLFEGRERTYQTARKMLDDYPVFGTGPGTFAPVFQLYRKDREEYWPAQLHNDWLETAITFGWVGSALIGAALLLAVTRWFVPGQIAAPGSFVAMLCVSLGGCLVHARVDFPFQIYSILFLAVLLCAVLFSVSRAER